MIANDFSNLAHRMLYTSILNAQKSGGLTTPKSSLHDMNIIKPFFLHLLFNNLKYVKETFSLHDNEEMVLCLDSGSWRKDYYPQYKANRKATREVSQINWEQFYKILNETLEVVTQHFPLKVLKYEKAEGDDVMAVLAKHFHNQERILLITEDKDARQLLEYPNVQVYRPIRREFVNLTKDELIQWRIEHILLGDTSDNIPTIKTDTEFTSEFLEYLKEKEVKLPTTNQVFHFNTLSNHQELLNDYTGVDKYGKNNTYKAAGFGEKSAQVFVPDILKNMRTNKLWSRQFRRNRVLVQFKYIPKHIEEGILEAFEICKQEQAGYNKEMMLEFFGANNLKQLISNIDSFLPISEKLPECTLDDWFN
jgi:5'-3' exonuclease